MSRTAQRRRRTALIRVLSELSRGGWAGARPEDYRPLETELESINRNLDNVQD